MPPPVDEPDDDLPAPPTVPKEHKHPELQAMIKALEIKLNAGTEVVTRMNQKIGEVETIVKQNNDQVNKQIVEINNDIEALPPGVAPLPPVDLTPLEDRLTALEEKRLILKATTSGNQLPDSVSGRLGDSGNPYVAIDVSKIENPE